MISQSGTTNPIVAMMHYFIVSGWYLGGAKHWNEAIELDDKERTNQSEISNEGYLFLMVDINLIKAQKGSLVLF